MNNLTSDREPYFGNLYASADDPYGVRSRWYEIRKRAVLLAALPNRHYARGYEPGCGIGELTVQLAERCDALLASDFNPQAAAHARRRTAHLGNVTIERHTVPTDWPRGRFDLIVLSEVGYFLDADAMHILARHCDEALGDEGVLVSCDWCPEFTERVLPTREVHAVLARLGLSLIVRHEESDFLLQIWSRDARSVAEREGIRNEASACGMRGSTT